MLKMTLSACRVNSGFNIREAAQSLGIHPQTLSKYEKDSGNIPFELLERMSMLYQVPMDNIFLGKKYEFIRKIEISRLQHLSA